jgi:hypothetical protein
MSCNVDLDLKPVLRWIVLVWIRIYEQVWTWMRSYCLLRYAAVGMRKLRVKYSVHLQWLDVGPTPNVILYVLILSEQDTCTGESLIGYERNILSYIKDRPHNDSWILDKLISIFTIYCESKVSSWAIISPVCWMPHVFPLKCDYDHFPSSTTDISKRRMLSHNPYQPPHPTVAPAIVILFSVFFFTV